jgi:AcrR family transcriptional regulator
LYYHFKDKAELFCALVIQDYIMLNKMLSDVLTNLPPAGFSRLETVMIRFIEFGLNFPNHYEIMFLMSDAELKRYSQPEQKQLFERFSAVVWEASGKCKEEYPDIPLFLFLSMHGFVTHHVHTASNFEEIEQKAKEHVKFLCRGLSE